MVGEPEPCYQQEDERSEQDDHLQLQVSHAPAQLVIKAALLNTHPQVPPITQPNECNALRQPTRIQYPA